VFVLHECTKYAVHAGTQCPNAVTRVR
jgi:hypothetical protein